MTRVVVPPALPAPLPEDRFAQNGDAPSPSALRRVAWAYNHVSRHQRKLVWTVAHAGDNTPSPATNDELTHPFCFRTGENVSEVEVVMGLGPTESSNGVNSAYCTVEFYDGSTTLITPEMYYPRVAAGPYSPLEVAWRVARITTDDGLLADTEYRGHVHQLHGSRLHSAAVYEKALTVSDSTASGVADPLPLGAHMPIYDSSVQDLAETGTTLWRHNASQLLCWSQHTPLLVPTPNSTTWENVFDSAVSAFSATTQGYHLATQYHDSAKADIPVVLGVYATRSSGTGTLEVKLEQSGGTLLSQTGIGTTMTPFNSSTHTIAAAAPEKTDILVRCSDNSTTWNVHAIGLWEYEA